MLRTLNLTVLLLKERRFRWPGGIVSAQSMGDPQIATWLSHCSYLKICSQVAALSDSWSCGVSARTSWPCVSLL